MSSLTVDLIDPAAARRSRSVWLVRFDRIADLLVEAHGVPDLGNFHDPVREIFYILLSAKTTDGQYRQTCRALFDRFPTLAALAVARVRDILACIRSGGLANKRASQIKRAATALVELGGPDPADRLRSFTPREAFDAITRLPGMGPKSALCVMMYSLNADVFPVDVNVQRIAVRLGAIPAGLKHYQAQRRLPPLVPVGRSRELHVAMVVHGREVCLPRRPKCEACVVRHACRYGRRKPTRTGVGRG